MATNIVRRYDVDGFHWDYIRYPTTDSGYNPTAIARYNAEFGLTGQPSPSSAQFSRLAAAAGDGFPALGQRGFAGHSQQPRDFVRRVRQPQRRLQQPLPGLGGWNSEGIIDICMPMGYTSDNAACFMPRVDDAYSHQGVRRVYNGPGRLPEHHRQHRLATGLHPQQAAPGLGALQLPHAEQRHRRTSRARSLTSAITISRPGWTCPRSRGRPRRPRPSCAAR